MVVAKKVTSSFKKVFSIDVVKVFSFTAIATLVKVLTSFITIKVVAVLVGPAGIALLGQLTNFSSIVMSVATGGINNGVTKYVAEHREERNLVSIYISTGFRIIISISIICGILLVLFSNYLGEEILLSKEYSYVFQFFGFTVVLYALNSFLVSVLNGYKEFKKYTLVGIITSIIGLIFTVSLVWMYKVKGALISAVTYQSIVFFISLILVTKSSWFTKANLTKGFSYIVAKKYLQYSLMALTSAATIPVSLLIVRGLLIDALSTNQAGLWEAMNKLSGMYLMVITTSFGVYYLPKLSEAKCIKLIKSEVITAFKFIMPLLGLILIIVFFMKDFIIDLLFTKEFYEMRDLFIWQLAGDFFKMSAWIMSFVLIAKSKTRIFIITEIIYSISYISFSYLLINKNGVNGATQAYFMSYLIYFLLILVIYRYIIKKELIKDLKC